MIRTILLLILALTAIAFIAGWRPALKLHEGDGRWLSPLQLAIGFVTDFLDTLGIVSFPATTFSAIKVDPKILASFRVSLFRVTSPGIGQS
ncbi:MAG: hypothetical protein ABIQ55_00055 [Gemmatimonadaceae bacterium]